jgi:uncharacterized protein Yka (UPF0111/DUF47 family)
VSTEADTPEPPSDGLDPGADPDGGIVARGEDALGSLAQTLLENPLFAQALGATLGAGERAAQAQKIAMGALDLSSASELERLERRVRQLSERLEAVEDSVDDVSRDLRAVRKQLPDT